MHPPRIVRAPTEAKQEGETRNRNQIVHEG
jgi:hypothetical protein